MDARRQKLIISAALVALAAAVFYPVLQHPFVSYDDANYVPDNPRVREGLTADGIAWAFTTRHAGYWHPVTWLSHMLDCQVFGLNAGGHHAVSLLLHAANALLLFALLSRMTGAIWRSAFVAALFAIHPLHVESVAWIAERKDVLSTFFWLLTVWAYVDFAERRLPRTYVLALGVYALGLMAKPMIITLPVILLLLDYWPLERMGPTSRVQSPKSTTPTPLLILEKVPFFLLAGASALVTLLTTNVGGGVATAEMFPLGARIANAAAAYSAYLWKMLWPTGLAVFYPFDAHLPLARVALAGLVLLVITVLVVALCRRHRYLLTGWLWYLVMLLPVIGLVQAGSQAMADRYTYLSLVGVFIMLAWGATDLARPLGRAAAPGLAVLAGAALLACAVVARAQVGVWQDSVTLFEHANRVTRGNFVALTNLGYLQSGKGDHEAAVRYYQESLEIHPTFAVTHNNLGSALMQMDRLDEAVGAFRRALELDSSYAEAHNNLGIALARQEKCGEAIREFEESLRLRPDNPRTRQNLDLAIKKAGASDEQGQ